MRVDDAVLVLPAASLATPEAIDTCTVPCPEGVIEAVYVVPLPAKEPAVPFVTVISPTTKPVTLSLKVIVTGIGDVFVTEALVEVAVTVGAVISYITDSVEEAAFPTPAASAAESRAIETSTEPSIVGVTSKV